MNKYYQLIEKHDDESYSITTISLDESTVTDKAECSVRGTLTEVINEIFKTEREV